VNNFLSQVTSFPTREHKWGFSVDHNISEKQKAHITYWYGHQSTVWSCVCFAPSNPLSTMNTVSGPTQTLVASYSSTVKSNLTMTAGLSFNSGEYGQHAPPGAYKGIFPALVDSGPAAPSFSFNNSPNLPSGFGYGSNPTQVGGGYGLGLNVNFYYARGRHTLTFGTEYRRSLLHNNSGSIDGNLVFNGSLSSDNSNFGTTGSSFASFLLGDVDTASRAQFGVGGARNSAYSPYVQDNIKVTPKLTANLGLRWDIMIPFTNAYSARNEAETFFTPNRPNPGAISTITGQPLNGAMNILGTCSDCVGYSCSNIHWKNLGPRIGLSYQMTAKTVVSGGYTVGFLRGGSFDLSGGKVQDFYTGLLEGFLPASIYQNSGYPGPGVGQWDAHGPNIPLPVPAPLAFSPAICNGTSSNQCVEAFSRDPGPYPYTQSWNMRVQRELPGKMFFSLAYVGNRGAHLPSSLQPFNQLDPKYLGLCSTDSGQEYYGNGVPQPLNNGCVLGDSWTCTTQTLDSNNHPTAPCPAPIPAQTILKNLGYGLITGACGAVYAPYTNFCNDYSGGPTLRDALVPFPQYPGTIFTSFENQGKSRYNSMQAELQKRFSNGTAFLVNYTLSRAMGNSESGFSAFAGNVLNKYKPGPEYSVAGFDQTHVIHAATVYELPIGPGKRFFNHGGTVMRNLLGGWQISGIANYQSGGPLGFGAGGNPLNTGFNRPNIAPGASAAINWSNVNKVDANGNPVSMLVVQGITDPGNWAVGNAPRNTEILRYRWSFNEDMGFAKKFFLGERVKAEFRIE
jgi:hypothetical protein